ncbi:MAG: D-alanyl-D-alanine carboxypeptidase [Lachnospiraceae bacterium]|nr:D-alanyl-D-alanine carboxypeptidase [Lachnospiraceae bacterium]
MKIQYRFLAGLLACSLSFTVFATPLPVEARRQTAAEKAAAEEAARQKEEERLSYYNKEIDSNSIPNWPQGPQIYADSAVIMEASTGTILYNKDMDKPQYPASITKVMTALVALEHASLDEVMTYSYYATHSITPGSSSIGTTEGEELTVEESLYALLLESANECGNGLAEHVAGSVEAFADMMNQKAADLGCTNTHFANPHGLHDENHYTSPHDMALITREAIKNETFVTISGTPSYDMRATNKDETMTYMKNHHKMIFPFRGDSDYLDNTVIAGKPGATDAALNTLVTVSERNGMTLIVVTMRTHSADGPVVPLYADTALLLDYASDNFSKINIASNETNFSVDNSNFFHTGSSIFGGSRSLVEVNPNGYIVLPNGVAFSEASPTLEFQNEGIDPDVVATLSYTYQGQPVGRTTIDLAKSAIQEFTFNKETGADQESPVGQDTKESQEAGQDTEDTKKTFIKINIRLVLIFILVIVIVILLLIFLRKLWRHFYFRERISGNHRRSRYRKNRRRRTGTSSRHRSGPSVRYQRTPKKRNRRGDF